MFPLVFLSLFLLQHDLLNVVVSVIFTYTYGISHSTLTLLIPSLTPKNITENIYLAGLNICY
jgi:hypothetical protein